MFEALQRRPPRLHFPHPSHRGHRSRSVCRFPHRNFETLNTMRPCLHFSRNPRRSPKIWNHVRRLVRYHTSSPHLQRENGTTSQSDNKDGVEILSVGKTLSVRSPKIANYTRLVNDGLTIKSGFRSSRFDSIWLRDSCMYISSIFICFPMSQGMHSKITLRKRSD